MAEEAAAGAPDALAPVTNVVYMGMGAPQGGLGFRARVWYA